MLSKNWKTVILVTIVSAIYLGKFLAQREITDNDVLETINHSGYHGEIHHVTTKDGYILGLHRVTKVPEVKKNGKKQSKKGAALFVHGIESSAMDWINYLGNKSLPFLMLEKGYDIWLGNVRGTPSSSRHILLDAQKDSRFWDFSFHEIGHYDLPAMIDYILETTKSKKLNYVGMSQGEATFLIMTSTRPEYNDKIRFATLTAASSHLKHSDNEFYKTLGNHWSSLETFGRFIGLKNIPGRTIIGSFCRYEIFSNICMRIISPLTGYIDHKQLKSDTISKHFQTTTKSGFKQLIHYLQLYNSGIFRHYDHGKIDNLKKYGSEVPPPYDLKKVTAPVAYFWGENDCWSRPQDIADIEKELPNIVLSYRIPLKSFNHMDVMTAINAKELLYDKIVETIEKFTK